MQVLGTERKKDKVVEKEEREENKEETRKQQSPQQENIAAKSYEQSAYWASKRLKSEWNKEREKKYLSLIYC